MTKLKDPITGKRLSAVERVAMEVAEYRSKAKLDSWNSFVEELQVPSELYPALVTNRPELLRLVQARPLTSDECAVIYKLVAGLLETNAALRLHTARVAQLTNNLNGAMKQFGSAAQSIQQFANFGVVGDGDEEDDDQE
jgi:hypothetical protein